LTQIFRSKQGFSLLEILISLTVLSFITLSIATFTDSSIDTSIEVTKEDNEAMQIETAMARFEWDIAQSYSPLYFDHKMKPDQLSESEGAIYNQLVSAYQENKNFSMVTYTGIPIPVISLEDKSELVFFTSSNRRKIKNSKQSHYSWVRYSLEADESDIDEEAGEKKAQILIRQQYTTDVYQKKPIDWDDVKRQVLLRKVISVKFEFWNPKNKKWTDSLSSITNGESLIHAVKVELKYFDYNNIEVVNLRMFRPLYPSFEAEDRYQFLNKDADTESATGGEGGTDNTTGGGAGTGSQSES